MNKQIGVIFLCVLCFCFTDCARRKILKEDTGPGKVKIKRKFRSQNAEFQYLNCKAKIEFTDGLQNVNSNATIRICKDSVIWVSIPVMGVEVLRCLINQDSLFIINKLQKEYYLYSFQELSTLLNFQVNYPLLQSILFGNPPFAEIDADSTEADSVFTILRQTRSKVSIENFVKNKNSKLVRLSLRDELTSNTLDINYEDFQAIEEILFAFSNKISLNYRDKNGMHNIYIGIHHNKIEPTNKDLKFPFNIPNRFDRKK